jgi:hypothetical protein
MPGNLIIRSTVNSHKRNIHSTKNSSLGLLLTLSESCGKALSCVQRRLIVGPSPSEKGSGNPGYIAVSTILLPFIEYACKCPAKKGDLDGALPGNPTERLTTSRRQVGCNGFVDTCTRFEIHDFVEDELAHFELKELAETPGE